jgi:3-ketosteroid 9alpha-monooxygenase subunit A
MATTAEYGLGEYTFPRGWFMVGVSADATTTPKAVRYFGEELVLYRGESGRVFLVEAYCPHMGTHLAKNTTSYVVVDHEHVEGDNIRCPYHGWRFGPDGQCNQIPKRLCSKVLPLPNGRDVCGRGTIANVERQTMICLRSNIMTNPIG